VNSFDLGSLPFSHNYVSDVRVNSVSSN
jgi:hypothetical protein